jgi:small ligand-binding sensory domain FIST
MRAGVGFSSEAKAPEAGRRAAADALRRGGVEELDLALAFCAGQLDAEGFQRGVRAALGPGVPILGGSAIGVISGERLSYEGAAAGVAVLDLGEPLRGLAAVNGLDQGELDAGRRLGRSLAGAGGADARVLLLFYDSIRAPPTALSPPLMNASRPLIAGLHEELPGCPPVIGAGLVGDFGFGSTWQFCGHEIGQQRAVAALLGSSVRIDVQVMHGCTPMDGVPHVLTRVEGGIVHEIDGRPAAEQIDDIYGSRDWRGQRPVNRLTLGVQHGERFGSVEEDCVNRLIMGVMPDGRAIGLLEPDLEEGAEVFFMLRDPALMIESARAGSRAALDRMRAAGGRPRFALYIDCAGRAAAASQTETEEAAEVQAAMNADGVPLLGFYSGVEVAPVGATSRGLDWTGVLLLLGQD